MTTDNLEKKPYSIIVKLSNDYYNAYVTIDAEDYNFLITKEEIIEALQSKKVVFGLNSVAIESIIKNPEEANLVEVASGIVHEHGEDSKIIYKVAITQDLKPKENEDGTMDFKNMDFAQSVSKGQVLAIKTPITLGENGTTVTGMNIKAKDGKICNFKFGKNVSLSDDEMSLISNVDGTLRVEGYKLSVIEVLEIFSDVGVKTGNILFSGKIIVRGNVTNGFKVESHDSIEIYGVVESAIIIAANDITINGGVQGNDDCLIQAGGSIKSNYFNNCKVISVGGVTADSIMHCNVICDETITVKGKKGLIMGGDYTARHHIIAKTIGTEIGTITKLQMGITNDIMSNFQDLATKVKEYKSNISKLEKACEILKKQKQMKPDDIKISELYESTKSSLTDYTTNLKLAMTDFKKVNDLIEQLKDVYAKAELFHPGVRIKIGNTHYNIKNDLVMAKITKDHGEIVVTSY